MSKQWGRYIVTWERRHDYGPFFGQGGRGGNRGLDLQFWKVGRLWIHRIRKGGKFDGQRLNP
jgi:hypothetical protein